MTTSCPTPAPGKYHVSIHVQEVRRISCHWHDWLEIVWVLRGRTTLCESTMKYYLNEGDIYVVNYNETHKIVSEGEPATLAFLCVDYRHFLKDIPNLNEISFSHYCFSDTPDPEDALASCRKYMRSLFQLLAPRPAMEAEMRIRDLTASFLKLLVDTFQYIYYVKEDGRYLDRLNRTDLTPKQMERIHRITYYIYMNCGEKITLDQLARTEFYSRFHISHFIKRAFGLSYQETLSLSRAVVSERILLATDFNLDQVAALAGFSTRSQYCNHFKRWHGISPARYRKENAAGAQGNLDITFPVSHQAAQALLSPLPESHPSLSSSFHSWEDAVPGKE